MPTRATVQLPPLTALAIDTTGKFLFAGAWRDATGLDKMRAVFEVRGLNGSLSVVPAVQFADMPDNPGTVTNIGTAATADGFNAPSSWTSVQTDANAKQLFRLGWFVKLTTGSTLATAIVQGKVEILTV
ncbi:MAG: hypothetical protein FJ255_12950 [Phycisphaerae bacterium]|nr:hypothetical protein [Phycisphaerae bacterium]